jgi:hypothetical protein
MKIVAAAIALLFLAGPTVLAQSTDPAAAVFRLQVLDAQLQSDGFFHGHGYGTGFFIAADGTALTASHVVYAVVHDPGKYRLLAIVGKEMFDANVVCASKLPYDPTNPKSTTILSRDVAEVRLAPSTMPEGHRENFMRAPNGDRIVLATAQMDPQMPTFPFLTIAGHAEGQVTVVGFGGISAIPSEWTATGRVVGTRTAADATPLFDVDSSNPPVPGDSGAPVLGPQDTVVGLWAWHSLVNPRLSTAEDASVLQHPCP